jgi:hypothetical protein
MNYEKKDAEKIDHSKSRIKTSDQQNKNAAVKPTKNQGARATKGMNSQRHPEEQNVNAKEYMPRDKKNLNDLSKNQRV